MIIYSYNYQHKTKEVVLNLQIGLSQPLKVIMSAEAFLQDVEFIKKDPKLAHWLNEVRKRKDLPIDHNFGTDAEIKFNEDEWNKRMGE